MSSDHADKGASPARPMAPPVDPEAIPQELRAVPQWVCWRYEQREDRWTKVPVNVRTRALASVTDRPSWATFDEAMEVYRQGGLDGVGLVFSPDDPYCGIDIDGCIKDGAIVPSAAQLLSAFPTYAEVSPSGNGVKLFLKGSKPAGSKSRSTAIPGFKEIEIYDRDRFFTVTGRKLECSTTAVSDCQDALDELCHKLWPPSNSVSARRAPAGPGYPGDDDDLLEAAKAAANGAKFRELWEGNTAAYGGDDSSADLALASVLAFWCGPDPDRIYRLITRSGLYRDKWNRTDYRESTIQKAIGSCKEFYTAGQRRSRAERGRLREVEIDIDEHRVIAEVVECLGNDEHLYQRGGQLVRISFEDQTNDGVKRPGGSPTIVPLPLATVREWITRNAVLVKYSSRVQDLVAVHPPPWLVAAITARRDWPGVRKLSGISDVPIVRADGSVLQTPGYDEQTGVYLHPAGAFPPIPENPTADDAWAAVSDLLEVVCDFKLESDVHRAAWLSGLLTPFGMFAYHGPAPLLLIDANVRAAGKGLLSQTIGEIALGRPLPVSTYCHDAEEMRKRITALAIAGDSMVLLDNIDGKFGNAALDAALTTVGWRDRVLGTSTQVTLPLHVAWYATGNNVQVAADTARRIVHCRLDVLDERPEERSGFRHPDLIGWVRAHRGRLVTACLVVLSAYLKAGRPDQKLPPMGSYEGWSSVIRSAVVWAGLPDPCESRKALAEAADTSRETVEMVIEAFTLLDPQKHGIVISELVTALYPADGSKPMDEGSVAGRLALENLTSSPPGKTPQPRQVGAKLRHYRRRVVNGWFLDSTEKRAAGAVWRLHKAS